VGTLSGVPGMTSRPGRTAAGYAERILRPSSFDRHECNQAAVACCAMDTREKADGDPAVLTPTPEEPEESEEPEERECRMEDDCNPEGMCYCA